MTIHRNINLRQIADDYHAFRAGVEAAPEGTFEASRAVFKLVDETMGAMYPAAKELDLVLDGSDLAFGTEAMLFEFVRHSNPQVQGEIGSVIALANTLSNYPEQRERILAGLERDRDCLKAIREKANDFVPGIDDQYERETPV